MGVRLTAAVSFRLVKDSRDTRQARGSASHLYEGLRQRSGFRADSRRALDHSGRSISRHVAGLLRQQAPLGKGQSFPHLSPEINLGTLIAPSLSATRK